MLTGLEQLKARTDEIGEDPGNKRQKMADGNKKPSSMEPFGGAGR